MVDAEIVSSSVARGDTVQGVVTRIVDRDDSVETYVTVDGREYLLNDWPRLWGWDDVRHWFADYPEHERGQAVELVLDPDPDPAYSWAHDVSRYQRSSWWAAIGGLSFLLGLAALVRAYATRSRLLPDGARWQRWRSGTVTTVTVIEVRERRPPRPVRMLETVAGWMSDHEHQLHHLVIEADGGVHFWEAKTARPTTIEPGTTFEVMGPVRRRGWIVGLTEPPLYPDARLD